MQKDIIVPPPVEELPKGPQSMPEVHQSMEVEWQNETYTVVVDRVADKEQGLIVDENGIQYYNNTITLKILRANSEVFVSRTYHKSDFREYVRNSKYYERSVLLGIVYDEVRDGKIYFAASVGAPDVRSDEFIPLVMSVSRSGDISIALDTRLDRDNAPSEDGITGDEEA